MRSLAVLALVSGAAADDPGRLIYQFGQADAPVLMSLPGESGFASARAMACAACHGFDGTGSAELGRVPDISRIAGTAADPAAFRRALTEGLGGDGRTLRVMPRYALTEAQRDALAKYVSALAAGDAIEPGVSADAVTIDCSGLPEAFVTALATAASGAGNEVYGRRLRLAGPGEDALVRLVAMDGIGETALPEPRAITLRLDTTDPQAAPATVRALLSILARGGRRLTRPGLAQIIERSGREG